MEIKLFERVERTFKNKIAFAKLTDKADNIITLQSFEIQPIEVDYNIEGIEKIDKKGDILSAVRFTPTDTGKYTLEIVLDNGQTAPLRQ